MKDNLKSQVNENYLPVFPLSVFILPEGKVRLRIFEAKYLRMLSLIASHQCFVIQLMPSLPTMNNNYWGSLVEIQDFNQGDDGILEIDVLCKTLVYTTNISQDDNELTFAQVTPFSHWSETTADIQMRSEVLATELNSVLDDNEILKEFYQSRPLNNVHWVVARWIELLPLSVSVKNLFIQTDSFSCAKDFVDSVIYK